MCIFAIENMRRMSPVDNTPLQKNAMNHHGVEEVLFCTFSSKNATYRNYRNDYTQSISKNFSRFSFTGKEKDEETGFGYFGARYMDHELTTMWLSVDPMADKYPSISPYNYCMWNPVKRVDPNGEKPVFVNGYLGFGSPEGGKKYWSSSFVNGAKKFFNDYTKPYFTNVEHRWYSSAESRQQNGYDYAKANYGSLIEGMKEGETFEFVSHSMGGAFAMGMKQYLEEQGWAVKTMVFINTYQSDKIDVKEDDPCFMIDYQNSNDPVLFLVDFNLGKGEIKNADVKIREKSDKEMDCIHAGPISSGDFWKESIINATKTNE